VRLLTGHFSLNRHLATMHVLERPPVKVHRPVGPSLPLSCDHAQTTPRQTQSRCPLPTSITEYLVKLIPQPLPQPFYDPFFRDHPGELVPELLDFMVQEKINRGRHTNHPAGRHSIRTNQCPPPPCSPFFYRMDALPAAQPTASKHQKATSAFGLGRRR